MKAFKTELDPNNVQTTMFRQHSGAGRWAYNWGLERIKEAIEAGTKWPSAIDLHKALNALKGTDALPWAYEVSKCAFSTNGLLIPNNLYYLGDQSVVQHRLEIRMKEETLIKRMIGAIVDAGELAGAATLAWRASQVIQAEGIGWRDREAQLPVERDTLFRIASMTKPITSVAALMLCEEGRFALDDPIVHWAPEFAQMRVLRSPTAALDQTDPAARPITFADLLTHRSGLTYGAFHAGQLATAYAEALGGDIDSTVAPDDWIARLAALPLIDQPGATLHYGHSTDLLGLLIARMEDATLGDVLKQRIFDPLGMSDTAFVVPQQKAMRRAKLYGFNDDGRLTLRLTGPGGSTLPERPAEMTYVSGGQGLWSTVDDYLAFARIFMGKGTVDGVQLLRPETVARMTTNQLTPQQRSSAEVGGLPLFAAGHGFGLGVAVVMEPEKAEPMVCGGSAGAVGWPGGFGGWWQADPNDGSVLIFLAHNLVEREQFANGIGFAVYGAIAEFQRLASNLPR